MPNYCMGSRSAGYSGGIYLPWATHCTPISVVGFLSSHLQGEAQALGHGIKDTKMLGLVNGVNIY